MLSTRSTALFLSLSTLVFAASLPACESQKAPAAAAGEPATAAPAAQSSGTAAPAASEAPELLDTTAGPLELHAVHHATVWFKAGSTVVWVDPWSEGSLDGPKADLILITDNHPDHLDLPALEKVKKASTRIIAPAVVAEKVSGAVVMKNGEHRTEGALELEAIPMYNLTRGPAAGKLYHDKGRGNGYVVAFGGKRVYFSGDTECIDEMRALKSIDLAFVCMNLPYTMPPSEAAECVKAFKPKVLVPYHYRGQKLEELDAALAGSGVVVHKHNLY